MKTTAADLERVALRLAGILGEDGLLVGAMAVAAHGFIRATSDVDFLAAVALAEVRKRLETHGIASTLHRGDFDCLQGVLDGVRFDVITPLVDLELDRAIEIPIRGGTLRVVDLDGLIRLKLKAQGPKDLMDVAALVLRHPDQRVKAREAASGYKVLDRLDRWLQDPRLASELLEAGRGEAASLKRARRTPARGRRRKR